MIATLAGGILATALLGAAPARDASKDWNFLFGTWRTHYKLLRHRLVNDHEWYACEGTSVVRPFWGGEGNLEDGDLHCPAYNVGGLTLRLYNRDTRQWSLFWGTRERGIVPPAQIGHFVSDGAGEFYAHDVQEGKHVIIRFQWTRVNGNPHFQQAFSADGGKTWETNWICDYERAPVSSKGVWNATESAADGHTGFDFLIGGWQTHYRRLRHPLANDNEWYSCEGRSIVTPFWAGSGNIEDGDLRCPTGDTTAVTVRVFNAATKEWQLWFGTQKAGLLAPPQVGKFDSRGVGDFFCADTWHGKPIIVRYRWTLRPDDHPYFEQAFSPDNGKTWETNWTTVYDRLPMP